MPLLLPTPPLSLPPILAVILFLRYMLSNKRVPIMTTIDIGNGTTKEIMIRAAKDAVKDGITISYGFFQELLCLYIFTTGFATRREKSDIKMN